MSFVTIYVMPLFVHFTFDEGFSQVFHRENFILLNFLLPQLGFIEIVDPEIIIFPVKINLSLLSVEFSRFRCAFFG